LEINAKRISKIEPILKKIDGFEAFGVLEGLRELDEFQI
jgi:hypothetical protein